MDLTIIIPAYNEEKNISEIHQSLKKILKDIDNTYEIIFIDDGSSDSTFSEIKRLRNEDSKIRAIRFNINSGKSAALNQGFKIANGEIIITMDADMQDDPEEIPRFIEKIKEGYDVVSGWKQKRKDPISKTVPSKIFNIVTSQITGLKLHDYNCGFKAYKKKVIKNINIYGELHRYIPALAFWKGFSVTEITVNHHKRKHGKSKFGTGRIFRGFFDLLTVKYLSIFLKSPLHFFGPIGIASMSFGILIGFYLVYLRYILDNRIGDRPLLMLSVLLLVIGLQFISMGFLGEMIAKTNGNMDDIVIDKEL